jgi:hypothetical protein
LSLIGAVEAPAAPQSAYFRILVSPDSVVYGLVWNDQLRLSATPEGLARAKPTKAAEVEKTGFQYGRTLYQYTFPEVTLSPPQYAPPEGLDRASMALSYAVMRDRRGRTPDGGRGWVYGLAGVFKQDEQGAEWSYWGWLGSEAGGQPASAPGLEIPDLKELRIVVTAARPEGRKVGVAAQIVSGEFPLEDIKKDGKSVPVSLAISSSDGKLVKSAQGDLSKFGFT